MPEYVQKSLNAAKNDGTGPAALSAAEPVPRLFAQNAFSTASSAGITCFESFSRQLPGTLYPLFAELIFQQPRPRECLQFKNIFSALLFSQCIFQPLLTQQRSRKPENPHKFRKAPLIQSFPHASGGNPDGITTDSTCCVPCLRLSALCRFPQTRTFSAAPLSNLIHLAVVLSRKRVDYSGVGIKLTADGWTDFFGT